jgi:hypothetical protein
MKRSVNSDGQPYHLYQQKNIFARPEPVPGISTLYVAVFIVVSDLVLVTQKLSSDFHYAFWVSNCHCI